MSYPLNKLFVLMACILLLSCSSNKNKAGSREELQKFLKIPEKEWIVELQKAGFGGKDRLDNTVLLVTHSTHCPSCLNELSAWDKINKHENKGFKVVLVVIERYESRYKNFLARNNLSIPSFQDRTASLIKNKFIPFTPIKLYFDPSGITRRMHIIGTDPSFSDFLEEIQSHNKGASFLDNYLNHSKED